MKKLIASVSCMFLFACSKNNFAGAKSDAQTPSESPSTSGDSTGTEQPVIPKEGATGSNDALSNGEVPQALKPCIDGDKLVVPWTGTVKACLDQGKTYNFDTKVCADLPQASFSCDWTTVKAKLLEKDLLSEVLKRDAEVGAKLVSCGQSKDGNRILVQWFKLASNPGVSCNTIQESASITTGCYTHYVGTVPPPNPTTDEEKRAAVAACMAQ